MKTILTLESDQNILAGTFARLSMSIVRDDNLSWDESGFVPKETGDYRVSGCQRIGPIDGDGLADLALIKQGDTGENAVVLGEGRSNSFINGSRIVTLKAGERIQLFIYNSGLTDFNAIAGLPKSEFVFERC